MDDYIQWDGAETSLENLLIWWATRFPFEHTDDCPARGGNYMCYLNCCEGVPGISPNQAIEGSNMARWPNNIALAFVDEDKTKTEIEIGDRIYFDGKKFRVVKHESL